MLVVAVKHLTNYEEWELSEICFGFLFSGLLFEYSVFLVLLCESCVVSLMAVGF